MSNDGQMMPPVNRAAVAKTEAVDPVAHPQTVISNPMYGDNDEEPLPDPHATPSGSQSPIYEYVNDDYAAVTESAYNIDTYNHLSRPGSPPELELPLPQIPMHPANPTTDAKPYDRIHRPSRSQLIKEVYYSLYDIISKNSDAQISNNRNITKTKEIQELIVTETQKPIINTPTEWFVQDGNGWKVNNNLNPDVKKQIHGPIFMYRIGENGKPIDKDGNATEPGSRTNPPVYDVLYYHEGNLNPEQSFIAPVGVPTGSKPTISEKIIEEVRKKHEEKAEAQKREQKFQASALTAGRVLTEPRGSGPPASVPYPRRNDTKRRGPS